MVVGGTTVVLGLRASKLDTYVSVVFGAPSRAYKCKASQISEQSGVLQK